MIHHNRLRQILPPLPSHQKIVFLTVVLILALASCRQEPIEEASSSTIAVPPTPHRETPSVTPTLLPQPTATLPPTPTLTLTPHPTACPLAYFFRPSPPTCPADIPLASFAAEQPFEGGVMIWFESTESIYVFYQDQRWQRFDDTWSEDQPTTDPSIIPPAERFQPIRGFGKVWGANQNVHEQLGWALGPELAFDSMMQQSAKIDNAHVIYLATFNGQVFALTEHDQDEGDWVIAAS